MDLNPEKVSLRNRRESVSFQNGTRGEGTEMAQMQIHADSLPVTQPCPLNADGIDAFVIVLQYRIVMQFWIRMWHLTGGVRQLKC